jgi:hypothetical protein
MLTFSAFSKKSERNLMLQNAHSSQDHSRFLGMMGNDHQVSPLSAHFLAVCVAHQIWDGRQSVYFGIPTLDIRNRELFDLELNSKATDIPPWVEENL